MRELFLEHRPLRVLTFTTLFPTPERPHAAIFIYHRTSALARLSGNEVHVVSPVPYAPSCLPVPRWQAMARVPARENMTPFTVYHPRYLLLPKISMQLHGFLMFLGCVSLVRDLHRDAKFDCIDAHFVYPDGFAACLLGRILGIPVVVSARGSDITLYPQFLTIRPLIRWTMRNAAGLIAVSESLKAEMVRLGAEAGKIEAIPNGVDTRCFFPEDRLSARQKLRIAAEDRVVVSVGSLLPVKGQERLISAICNLKARWPTLRAYLIGDGPMRPKLEDLIQKLKLQDSVFLVGSKPNEELRWWFSAADVSCLTSSREGWPNVVSESLACGTPVVATQVGGVAEIIFSSELGMVVNSGVPEIAAGLQSALERNWDRRAISARCSARNWDDVAREVDRRIRRATSS